MFALEKLGTGAKDLSDCSVIPVAFTIEQNTAWIPKVLM